MSIIHLYESLSKSKLRFMKVRKRRARKARIKKQKIRWEDANVHLLKGEKRETLI